MHILTHHVLDNIICVVTSGEAWEVLAATPILLTIDSAGDDDDEEEELSENFSTPTLRTVAPENKNICNNYQHKKKLNLPTSIHVPTESSKSSFLKL